jgi:hypothetical protein
VEIDTHGESGRRTALASDTTWLDPGNWPSSGSL